MNVIQFSTANKINNSKDNAVLAKYKGIVKDKKLSVRRNGFLEFYVAAVRSGLTRKKMYDRLGYSPQAYECLEVQAIERKIEDLRLCFDLQKEIMTQGNDFASFVEIA